MHSRMLLLLCTVLALALAVPSLAGNPESTNTGQSSVARPNLEVHDITVWCQSPDLVNWAKLANQIDPAYPFDAGSADDYESSSDFAVTSIQWWGGMWNYEGYGTTPPPCVPDHFVLTVYAYDGTCTVPDPMPVAPDYMPNNYLHQEIITTWTEAILDPAFNLVEYSADIGPLLQDAGARYWIEIQAVMPFDGCGQWGQLSSVDPWGCRIQRGFPLLGNPYWYGDIDYPGLAFCLYSDQTVDADNASWGGVKSLFR